MIDIKRNHINYDIVLVLTYKECINDVMLASRKFSYSLSFELEYDNGTHDYEILLWELDVIHKTSNQIYFKFLVKII